MNRHILMAVILLCALQGSIAKLYFPNFLQYHTYKEGVAGQIYNMVPFQNNGYIMAGRANTNDFLIKTDLNGIKEWEYFSDDQSYNYSTATCISKSGNCMLAGSQRVCTKSGTCYSAIRLRSISSSGNLLWEKYYDHGTRESPVSLCEMDDGGFLIAGNSAAGTYNINDLVFIRTDSKGNLLWKKNYGAPDLTEVVYAAEKTADNGLMVLAHKNMDNRTWLLRLNSVGDTLWTKILYYKSGNRLLSIKRTADNKYICAGASEGFYSKTEFWILKMDDLGNAIWTKSYSKTDRDTAKTIDTVAGGGYCFAGNSGPSCVLMRIGPTGDSLWSLDYGYYTPVMPTSLIVTPSGQFALGGNTGPSNSSNDVFFLLFESESKSTKYSEFANWELIDTSNSLLPSNHISKIAVDSTNRIWLVIWDQAGPKYHMMNQSGNDWKSFDPIPSQQIMKMTVTSSGHMWFAGDNGVYHYDGNVVTNTPVSLQAFDVAPISNTEAYVGGTYGLYKLTNGTLSPLASVADTAVIKNVDNVMIDSKANIWYSSMLGVAVKNNSSTVLYTPKNSPLVGAVREMRAVGDNVWISTTSGLVKNTNGKWTTFDSTNSILPSNNVNTFAIDSKGNALIGCNQGFVNLSENKVYHYNNSPLPSNIINCMAIDKKGNVLIGTNQGLVIIWNLASKSANPVAKVNLQKSNAPSITTILNSGKNNVAGTYTYYNLNGKMLGDNRNIKSSKMAGINIMIRKQLK